MTGRNIAALVLIAALTACGGRQPLEPIEGQPPIATPVGAAGPPSAADLTTPSTQVRPQRNDEPLTQSQVRPDDPFDLPPEGKPQR